MLINASLSPETAAQNLRNTRTGGSSPAPAGTTPKTPGQDAALRRLEDLAPMELDGISGITDTNGADQATEFLRASMLSQSGTALAAQANLNPDAVFGLLL